MTTGNYPAFPFVETENAKENVNEGISIRTYIATHALQGILAANYLNDGLGKQQAFIFINDAVFLADELINALNQPTNTTAP